MDKPKKRILVDWGILMRRLKKFLIGTIIFFVVFTIVGFFVLPPIVKSILTKKLSENLHRRGNHQPDQDQSLYPFRNGERLSGEGSGKLRNIRII